MPSILPPRDILETDPKQLYKIGFSNTGKTEEEKNAEKNLLFQEDILQRAAIGKKLSNICENLTDPLTIALNSGWGTGKTWFLKRWAGAHSLENGGKALTVYLSAFNHDYLEDPLPSIILAIEERLGGPETKSRKIFAEAKRFAGKLAVPAFKFIARTGAAAATAGASEIAAAGITAIDESLEKSAESYWLAEKSKREAIEEFRAKIAEFAQAQPLSIIIDELDRAKPDYALAVLETIKHFFDVDGVKFILGVNLSALAQMVTKRYGFETAEAQKYLERFINFSMTMPDTVSDGQTSCKTALAYCDWAMAKMGLCVDSSEYFILNHLYFIAENTNISLRDIQRILAKFKLIAASGDRKIWDSNFYIMEICLALISSEFVRPDLYPKFLNATISKKELLHYYNIQDEYEFLEQDYDNYIQESEFNPTMQEVSDSPSSAFVFIEGFVDRQISRMGQVYYPEYKRKLQAAAAFLWIKTLVPAAAQRADEFTESEQKYLTDKLGLKDADSKIAIPRSIFEKYIEIFSLNIKANEGVPPLRQATHKA